MNKSKGSTKIKKGGKRRLLEHLVDSTFINSVFMPLGAMVDKFALDMTDERSFKTRVYSSLIVYGGIGSLSKMVDYSREKFKVPTNYIRIHDSVLAMILGLGTKPLAYLFAGETDWKKIAFGTAFAGLTGGVLGGPLGYGLDIYRELTEVKESKRTPEKIKNLNSRVKKGLAGLIIASSIATVIGVYVLTPDEPKILDNSIQYLQKSQ